MSGDNNSPELLKVKEAADILGVSEATLRNWDRAGKLKAKRHPFNGYRLYEKSEVLRVRESIWGGSEDFKE